MELRIPARISARAAAERAARSRAARSRDAGCDGLARVDFFVEGERVLVNELNTMPGFTPTSVYAQAARGHRASPTRQLVDRLCRLALERHAAAARLPLLSAQRRSVIPAIVADCEPGGSVVIHIR